MALIAGLCCLSAVWIYSYTQSTYIYRYRAVSVVFRTIDPPPPLLPARAPKAWGGGGTHSPGGEGVGGSIFRKTPGIGLASYSIIPLRSYRSSEFTKKNIRQNFTVRDVYIEIRNENIWRMSVACYSPNHLCFAFSCVLVTKKLN